MEKKMTPRQVAITEGRVQCPIRAEIEARTADRLAGSWKLFQKAKPLGRWIQAPNGYVVAAR